MNGSLLAVLGVVILVVIVLILKMRAGKSTPDAQLEGERERLEGAKEKIVPDEVEVLVDETVAAGPVTGEKTVPGAAEERVETSGEETLAQEEPSLVLPQEDVASVLVAEEVIPEPSGEAEPAEEPILADDAVAVEEVLPRELEIEQETLISAAEPEHEDLVESTEAAEAGEMLEPLAEPVTAEVTPEEPEPIEQGAEQPADAPVSTPGQGRSEKPAETGLMLVRLSMEAYTERLNHLEEQQRVALAEAIANNDDRLRDQLQRELVVMNDRLSLVADHYVEEMATCQQVLDALVRLQAEEPGPALTEAINALQSGQTEAAAAFLENLSSQAHPFAAQAAFLSGQLAESRVDLQKAMGFYRQAVAQNPRKPEYLRAAGLMARGMYKYKEALPWLESYVNLIKENDQADTKAVALAQRELAYAYVLSGQYQKAGPLYKESMTTLAQKLGPDHPEMALSWQQIGEFQETMGEYDKAVSLYKKALAILEKKRGPEHPALAGILRKLAALCVELELEPEAVPLYEKLVRIQEKALRPTHPQLVISLNNLAEAYRLQGRYADAEVYYLKTLRINEGLHGKEHPSVAAILQELAKLCTSQRKPEEAKQYQERASAIFQKCVEDAEKKAGEEESLTLELS